MFGRGMTTALSCSGGLSAAFCVLKVSRQEEAGVDRLRVEELPKIGLLAFRFVARPFMRMVQRGE